MNKLLKHLIIITALILAPLSSIDARFPRGVAPGCSQSNAFLARTSGLDATHVNAYNDLICGLVADGVWASLDELQIYATQDSTTALLNLVSTSFNGTIHGSPTFTADRGFTGVEGSTTVYIDTGYNVSITSGTINYTQNSAHLSSWQVTNGQGTASFGFFLGTSGINSYVFPRFTDNTVRLVINDNASVTPIANSDSRGHFLSNRSGASATQEYINGSSVGTGTSTSISTSSGGNLYSLGWNSNSIPHGYGQQMAEISGGASLDAILEGKFYARLRTYMTAVGVP